MNEAQTRFEHIDPDLKAAGWGVVEGSRIRLEYPISPGRLEGHDIQARQTRRGARRGRDRGGLRGVRP